MAEPLEMGHWCANMLRTMDPTMYKQEGSPVLLLWNGCICLSFHIDLSISRCFLARRKTSTLCTPYHQCDIAKFFLLQVSIVVSISQCVPIRVRVRMSVCVLSESKVWFRWWYWRECYFENVCVFSDTGELFQKMCLSKKKKKPMTFPDCTSVIAMAMTKLFPLAAPSLNLSDQQQQRCF